jgi:2-polyprenyl-3-methyl-5-hydroxy-6-metoxy-1,4-benzoquinol methylase
VPLAVEHAIERMLATYRDNGWFIDEHWPVNAPHVRRMVSDLEHRLPGLERARVLDVGCFNGYVGCLLTHLGCRVTGTDACLPHETARIFQQTGMEFLETNLNSLEPFQAIAPETFDAIIIAQVIEHVLNHPLGLLRDLYRVLRPDGVLILTTPNPATLMNAVRLVRGTHSMWGTRSFIDEPKLNGREVITKADIHYREYSREELRHLLEGAGLRVEEVRYLGLGTARSEGRLRTLAKGSSLFERLSSTRLLGSNHYVVARR